jgi:hypothetical protein
LARAEMLPPAEPVATDQTVRGQDETQHGAERTSVSPLSGTRDPPRRQEGRRHANELQDAEGEAGTLGLGGN